MSVAERAPHESFSWRRLLHAGRPAWPLRVIEKSKVAARMMRVRFSGETLDRLVWKRGQDLMLEIPNGSGIARRHFTIREHDAAAKTLAIDFVLHGESHTGRWLQSAKPGERIAARGPRGRTVVDDSADWHLFLGDETALPGIFAMLEGLPAGATAFALIEIGADSDKPFAVPRSGAGIEWISRGAPPGPNRALLDRLERFYLPAGRGKAYIGGETSNVRALRHHLLARGFEKAQIAAEGFWRPGRVGGHDHV